MVNVGPAPTMVLPLITIPPTDSVPPVVKLPPVVLPVTLKLVSVPTLVIFGCAFVVRVPVINVADKLLPVMLPVALINPAVTILPP